MDVAERAQLVDCCNEGRSIFKLEKRTEHLSSRESANVVALVIVDGNGIIQIKKPGNVCSCHTDIEIS
jgi:hypothetical protein